MKRKEIEEFLSKKVQVFLYSGHIFKGQIRKVRENTLDLIEKKPKTSELTIKILLKSIASIKLLENEVY